MVMRAMLAAGLIVAACGGANAQTLDPGAGGGAKTVRAGEPNAKAKIYDESADVRAQIGAALAAAKRDHSRVLIQWGGNWCPWCVRLHELMSTDANIKKELQYEYVVVHADCGKPAGKNVDVAASYGADVKAHGFPFLTVLDADGKPVANQETDPLEVKNDKGESIGVKAGHDAAKVLAFLKANQAPASDAQQVLQDGLSRARSSGRVVFLHFGAPWCVWCHRLEDWMARPYVAALLAKDFVDVKVDSDRFTGGKALLEKYASGAGGIPFIVFMDAEGRVIADGKGSKGNIGFPSETQEIEHFKGMLKKAVKTMSSAEVEALVDSLKAKEAAGAGEGHGSIGAGGGR